MRYRIFLICAWFLLSFKSESQSIKNLVFEGAGIKGLAYAGAVEELETLGILKDVEKVGGTSAGAITAMLISIGYNSQEIAEIISSTQFNKFNDGRWGIMGGVSRMRKRFGWYRGDKFSKWLGDIIMEKTGNPDLTFMDLETSSYKSLYVTGTALNQQRLVVFNAQTYPNMKVRDAIRISMSVPLYFSAVFMNNEGKVYKKQNKEGTLQIMVDGGITGNFPIFLFDTYDNNPLSEARVENMSTLGFRIDTDTQIELDRQNQSLETFRIVGFRDYIIAFYTYILESLNRMPLTEKDWQRTVSISNRGIGPKVKKLSEDQKASLIESGRSYTREYFNNK